MGFLKIEQNATYNDVKDGKPAKSLALILRMKLSLRFLEKMKEYNSTIYKRILTHNVSTVGQSQAIISIGISISCCAEQSISSAVHKQNEGHSQKLKPLLSSTESLLRDR